MNDTIEDCDIDYTNFIFNQAMITCSNLMTCSIIMEYTQKRTSLETMLFYGLRETLDNLIEQYNKICGKSLIEILEQYLSFISANATVCILSDDRYHLLDVDTCYFANNVCSIKELYDFSECFVANSGDYIPLINESESNEENKTDESE